MLWMLRTFVLFKEFPDLHTLYISEKVETMPWYNENLDSDLEEELHYRKITNGKFLDLGNWSSDTSYMAC